MFSNIGTTELLIIGGILILLFGSKKIPELTRGLTESIGEFKKGLKEEDGETELAKKTSSK